ncbi:hypothetical protein MKZ38_008881 [Zalerion maritima]|uniref:Uncharacterized protein n=1 Tax=Zalerion maritima TaxID=339359 RepID=A0AAD5RTY6_9PEZI|nr:hypothetical protein MKZ38_008881 [Zalerion maritima]
MDHPNTRYRSRVLREMAQSRTNPFNSPPSSTGSHGSVSPTMTSVMSFGEPDGESTRKIDDDMSLPSRRHRSARFGPHSVNINTSAIERAFPGWYKGSVDEDAESTLNHSDSEAGSTKENNPPPRPRSVPQMIYSAGGKPRTLSEMQPRVDNESTTSTVLSTTDKMRMNPKDTGRSASMGQLPSRKNTQFQAPKKPHDAAPWHSPATCNKAANTATVDTSMNTMNKTMGSFFLPNLTHVNDFVSGNLKFSAMKNGVPVFVKDGKVFNKIEEEPSQHAKVDNMRIPEDEQKIFVSMDMIKEEIAALQEHHDMLQREAEQLQDDVNQLHSELERLRLQKRSDSALGSDSDRPSSSRLNSQKTKLEDHIATLQMRLDHATRQISLTDIHQSSLSAERDQAIKELASAYEKMKTLEVQVAALKKELESMAQLRVDNEVLRTENKSLRSDNNALREDRESLTKENHSLRTSNRNIAQQHDSLSQDYATVQAELDDLHNSFEAIQSKHQDFEKQQAALREDNESLEHHNERFFQENQKLRHENVMYERKNNDLNDKCDRLQQLIDLLEQETHTQTKTIDAVLELKEENTKLTREVEKLQIQLISQKPKEVDSGLKQENARLNAEVESVRKQAENAQQSSSQLETENTRLRIEVEGLKLRTQRGANSPRADNIKEFYEIKERLSAAEGEIDLLRKEKSALSSKFDSLQARYTALSEDNNRAYRQLDQYQAQFLDMVKQMQKNSDETAKNGNHPTKQVTFAEPPNMDHPKSKIAVSESTATGKTSTGRMEEDFTQQFQFNPSAERTREFTVESNIGSRPAVRRPSRVGDTLDKQTMESDFPARPLSPVTYKPTTAKDATNTDVIPRLDPNMDDAEFKDTMPSDLPPRPAMRPGHARMNSAHTHTLPTMSFDLSNDLPLPTAQWSGAVTSQRYAELKLKSSQAREATRTMDTEKSAAVEESDIEELDEEDIHNPPTMDMTTEDNMTSAFFIDDITIDRQRRSRVKTTEEQKAVVDEDETPVENQPSSQTESVPRHSESAVHIGNGQCSHNAKNCTFCTQMCDQKIDFSTVKNGKKTIQVSRPVPVSDRVLDYTEEPTMRPSRDPGEALAIVIKSLQDEAHHLKKVITATRERYDSLDASVNRRARKQLSKDLHQQMRVLDCKNDQIYALYDVLEGQKRVDQQMSKEQLDVTVCSIMGMTLNEMSVTIA